MTLGHPVHVADRHDHVEKSLPRPSACVAIATHPRGTRRGVPKRRPVPAVRTHDG